MGISAMMTRELYAMAIPSGVDGILVPVALTTASVSFRSTRPTSGVSTAASDIASDRFKIGGRNDERKRQ
jgi:hypothetical protein